MISDWDLPGLAFLMAPLISVEMTITISSVDLFLVPFLGAKFAKRKIALS